MIFDDIDVIEQKRLQLQQTLDAAKSKTDRNRLGQFATPSPLATDILQYARRFFADSEPIRFLDPAFGTGAFYTALRRVFPHTQIEWATGYEIDADYGLAARSFWNDNRLDVQVTDFTKAEPFSEKKYNLLICNPPYVRHHHLSRDDKFCLQQRTAHETGYQLNGLTGLYCYFLLLSQRWLAPNGIAGWLIPSEFLEVNYGVAVKQFLLKNVILLHIHRFRSIDVQFADALVSSVLVWFRNTMPTSSQQVTFSLGGRLTSPEASLTRTLDSLNPTAKWNWQYISQTPKNCATQTVSLADLFYIKRGIATGANKFFILTAQQVADLKLPAQWLKPILPSPRFLIDKEIETNQLGHPQISKQLFLLDCHLPEAVIETTYPAMWAYLQQGIEQKIHQRYLCRHRTPWYAQENRPPAPILCTYMGRSTENRSNPFRFILNHSQATAPNVYLLLYPKQSLTQQMRDNPHLLRLVWQTLNQLDPRDLTAEGRLYGGGLHKIEPNELAQAKISLGDILPRESVRPTQLLLTL